MQPTNSPKADNQIIDKAIWVAKECLSPRASRYDESASFPIENWSDLWKHGLLSISVPKAYGGLELDMPTYILVIENLAKGCTNSAMTLHMHSVVQQFINELATKDQKKLFYTEVMDYGKLFASWGSEPGRRSGSQEIRQTVVTPHGQGYSINGTKHFCSMAGAAHRYLIHCTMDGYEDNRGYQLALVPNDASGITISGEWNTLGMRGTVSPNVTLENCVVDENALLGGPGEAMNKGVIESFGLGYAAIYLGAAKKAFEFTMDFYKSENGDPSLDPPYQNPIAQRTAAEMSMALESAQYVIYNCAKTWADASPVERKVFAARSKYIASQASLQVTSQCIQAIGGRSAQKAMPLERIYRDIRTATLMPPNIDLAMEIIGKAELGVKDY